MKKDILLIANFWHFNTEKGSSRYRSMADLLSAVEGYSLEVITSTFRHQTKAQRDPSVLKENPSDYKVTLLYEPGYKKNITPSRLYSHHVFASNIVKYLRLRIKEGKKPDIIICSVPSLAVGSAVTKFANKHSIKVIIDIQDLWPESFKMAWDIPVVSDILFAPMLKQAHNIYCRADFILAVSETYANLGKKFNPSAEGYSIFIGSDSKLIAEKTANITVDKPENEFWVGYVGSLGHSYDIKSVILAIKKLRTQGIDNIIFKVMGSGVSQEEFKRFAEEQNVPCDFTGPLEYGLMMKTLMSCEVAVNPIVGKSVSSIINKVADYAGASVPVINTQNCEEYRSLLCSYNAGINVDNGNTDAFAEAILKLYKNPQLRNTMSKGQQAMYSKLFDRHITYPEIINIIEKL